MTMNDFIAEIQRIEPGLLGTKGVSHSVENGRVHLIAKDDPENGVEVWIYANPDGTFTYSRGGQTEIQETIDDLIEAVYGNDPGETEAG